MPKVEEPKRKGIVCVKAIRVYSNKLDKEIDSTIESGETPKLLLKDIVRQSTSEHEIEMVFLGEYHLEDLEYFSGDPKNWVTWGDIILSPDQAYTIGKLLIEFSEVS